MGCVDLYDPDYNVIHLLEPHKHAKRRFRYWIFRRWGWTCAYCGEQLHHSGPQKATLDHVIPRYRGGKTTQWNLVPACHCCNHSKSNRDVWEWYRATPFFLEIRASRIKRWTQGEL